MSVAPVRWRPLGSADLDHAWALINEAIAPWQQAWFDERVLRIEDVEPIASGADLPFPESTVAGWFGPIMAWSIESAMPASLVDRALDLSPASRAGFDTLATRVMSVLEGQLVDELSAALHTLHGSSVGAPASLPAANPASPTVFPHGGVHVRLTTDTGKGAVHIALSAQWLWERSLHRVASPPRPKSPLVARIEAISCATVTVSARLGFAELTVPQLLDLAVGDVVAIERPLVEPIELIVARTDGPPAVVANGRPGHVGDALSIQLTSIAEPDLQ
ncbi:FliM/FliN family flagellar motor C-terminal domain-containing protein [Burkholderia cepacia]|uniref:Surface presentation of antigens family protein n=1 Tax=Burkholderia cepacia TaxID=292 RepID=A0AA88Z273_BURCE|nr:FliM/FliN family flagellar motor C-terminal domain-containing protein [Burkholderia cepacia]KGB99325.1 surface presentation of antigens family protein [Burkholderia cepacia]